MLTTILKGASARATGTSPTGAGKLNYTFATPQDCVRVALAPHAAISGGNPLTHVFVRWNADDAAATVWDDILEPGGVLETVLGFKIESVSLYFPAAATFGTHYDVRGWTA